MGCREPRKTQILMVQGSPLAGKFTKVGTLLVDPFRVNQRYASIHSALILESGTAGNAVNTSFGFMNITSGGTYQISIGRVCLP